MRRFISDIAVRISPRIRLLGPSQSRHRHGTNAYELERYGLAVALDVLVPTRPVRSLHVPWRVRVVNARELVESLAALPGVRSVTAATAGIEGGALVNGIEVAHTANAAERTLRAAWRRRTAGGPTPLLLLSDDPETDGVVVALGPVGGDGPLRLVSTKALADVIRRASTLPSLQAVRDVAEQLEHLDRTGVAGLTVKGLGTDHLFRERLRQTADWATLRELAANVRGDWREALRGAGYELEELQRGYLARHDGAPVAVVHPVADVSAFARLDAEGRPPEGILLEACRRVNAGYGILAAGTRLRLFEASPESGSAIARYLELDTAAVADDDRPLLGLLAPPYLADGGFAGLMSEARAYGVALRKRLDGAIRELVLPPLGRELGRWAVANGRDLADDAVRRDLEAAALTFVFRALFLLYAESRGYLPMARDAYERRSLTRVARDAFDQSGTFDPRSTKFWDGVQTLVRAMRSGDDALGVPPYNGDLFAPDGFDGAETLDEARVPDDALGPALVALGIEPDSGDGYDFSGLDIGHLGNIYEGLLSLRLSLADRSYRYDARRERYVPAGEDDAEYAAGELLWLTDEGGRKGGGVYYTPEPLVRHLVRRGVLPAFERHLERVAARVRDDPAAAARELFEFRVLDPACGSAHFLVAVVDELADRIARFLGEHPLPRVARELDDLRAGAGATYGIGVEDVALLRRLVLRRCVYGVDLSPMGAEIAKISLWLASFVPGLSLAYLDHNVRVGNSLIGVASAEQLLEGDSSFVALLVTEQMAKAAKATEALHGLLDRNPEEVARSEEADAAIQHEVEGARTLLDLWVAEPLGLEGARAEMWAAADEIASGRIPALADPASRLAAEHRALHWPLAFPEVFAAGGFDAVVGNPPWEEVTVEALAFYARYQPGLRALGETERNAALERLQAERPELAERLALEQKSVAALRRYFGADTGYEGGAGDPDLYKLFCQRYRRLLRRDATLAVVLPRSTFLAKGSADFRRWLFEETTVERLDFLLNNRRWMFDTHPQYTVALLVAAAATTPDGHRIAVAGVADSLAAFLAQSAGDGLALDPAALGPEREVPLLPSQAAADLLATLRGGEPFPLGAGRWKAVPVREFDEANDKQLWEGVDGGWNLWKGESFDQYDPNGAGERRCAPSEAAMKKARKPNPGKGSIVVSASSKSERVAAVATQLEAARVAFRDVTRATDSRTVRACLVPPETFLTNKAPWLAFVDGDERARAAALALLDSLPLDWQARRFVETNLNFFILEGLRVPPLDDETYEAIATAAARLSCPDERFAEFAQATGVEVGPLSPDERDALRAEIDARVAHAWGLDQADLETIFADFTLDAVPEPYRRRVRARLDELSNETTRAERT
ncbi:MAG: hypothetical protein M5U27_15010 [Gaiella sp.]|nr:hypothetical protein [Gaiella sp.]